MDDPDMALDAIENGICDIISLGRPLLADPDYANKLRAGKVADIRPCIGCQEGCMGRIQKYSMINCAVNPQCARERAFAYNPILKKKKVVIIGVNCTPFVRQYDILSNKWGVLLCQKGYQTNGIHRNSKSR